MPKVEVFKTGQIGQPIKEQSPKMIAYVSDTGKLFIPTPFYDKTFTVYPSVKCYNERLCLPCFIDSSKIDTSKMNIVNIDINTLTIN